MNRFATIGFALLASLASTAASHAQVYGGFSVAPGTTRIVTLVSQTASPDSNATSVVAVERCSGVIEYPVLSVASPTICATITADYKITMEVVSPTQTRITILAISPTCTIRTVTFGNLASRCGFDLLNPNPGTANSLAGANPSPVTMLGSWTVRLGFDNIVRYPSGGPGGDLYSRMTVSFVECFDAGDMFVFTVDTDRIR